MEKDPTQKQYWNELYQLRTHTNFVELKLEQAESWDRAVKVILATASSSSIGAWVIWNEYSWVWACIIAVSQVISAINPFLPYKSRIKAYSSLISELEELVIQSEFKWHEISLGKLTPTEINKARFEIKTLKNRSLKKYIQTTLPTDGKVHSKAEESARLHFETFYKED